MGPPSLSRAWRNARNGRLRRGLLFYIRARERGHSLMEGRAARQIIDEAQDRQLVIDEFRERCGG